MIARITVELHTASVLVLYILIHVIVQMAHQLNALVVLVIVNLNHSIALVQNDFILKVLFHYGTIQLLEIFQVLLYELDLILLVKNMTYLAFIVWYLHDRLIELLLRYCFVVC